MNARLASEDQSSDHRVVRIATRGGRRCGDGGNACGLGTTQRGLTKASLERRGFPNATSRDDGSGILAVGSRVVLGRCRGEEEDSGGRRRGRGDRDRARRPRPRRPMSAPDAGAAGTPGPAPAGSVGPVRTRQPEKPAMDGPTYAVRLRDLEARVDELKDQIRRSHTRLALLSGHHHVRGRVGLPRGGRIRQRDVERLPPRARPLRHRRDGPVQPPGRDGRPGRPEETSRSSAAPSPRATTPSRCSLVPGERLRRLHVPEGLPLRGEVESLLHSSKGGRMLAHGDGSREGGGHDAARAASGGRVAREGRSDRRAGGPAPAAAGAVARLPPIAGRRYGERERLDRGRQNENGGTTAARLRRGRWGGVATNSRGRGARPAR